MRRLRRRGFMPVSAEVLEARVLPTRLAVLDVLPDLTLEAGAQDVPMTQVTVFASGYRPRSIRLTPQSGTDFSAIEDFDVRADLRDAQGRLGRADGVYETSVLRNVAPVGNVMQLDLSSLGIMHSRTGLRLLVTADIKDDAQPEEIGVRDPVVRISRSVRSSSQLTVAVVGADNPTHTIEVGGQLIVTERSGPTTDTAVENERDLVVGRFEAFGDGEDLLVTSVTYRAVEGSAINGTNYTLWVDTDGNSVVDTVLEMGVASAANFVTFDSLVGGGYAVADGEFVRFEVHMDAAASFADHTLQFSLESMETETLSNGVPIGEVIFRNAQTVWYLEGQGRLFVTEDSTPVRDQFLLGGTLTESILRLQLVAEYEAIDVTRMAFAVTQGTGRSIDRLELYRVGEMTPFATATIAAGIDGNFTAVMQGQQLLVPEGQSVNVLVRARVKRDSDGGVSGDTVQIGLVAGSVHSRGGVSSNELPSEPTQAVLGSTNLVVMSEIASVRNANPDANGSAIPTGASPLGQFRFTAAAHSNSRNGLNDVVLETFSVVFETANVAFATDGFRFYNKADSSTATAVVSLTRLDGTSITGPTVTGVFRATFAALSSGDVLTEIDSGMSQTFVVEARITNPLLNSALSAHAQVFADLDLLSWLDRDNGFSNQVHGTDLPDTDIRSTLYQF